jgi:hypothetical protein
MRRVDGREIAKGKTVKIDPPDRFRIPESREPQRSEQVSGAQTPESEAKIERAQARKSDPSEPARARSLRDALGDIDLKNPDQLQEATDRIVDWALSDSFGAELVQSKGIESLRAWIREQLLADPAESARLKNILDRL